MKGGSVSVLAAKTSKENTVEASGAKGTEVELAFIARGLLHARVRAWGARAAALDNEDGLSNIRSAEGDCSRSFGSSFAFHPINRDTTEKSNFLARRQL
jgi:hypothetical protein